MGTAYNPTIVRNGLIYYTDFANLKSYPPTGNDPYVSNVTLQLNGEGSAVYDSSIYSRTISVSGTVAPSTAQAKYGNSSLPFSSNNYLNLTSNYTQTGNFTFETWIYPVATSSQNSILQIGNESTNRIVFFTDGSNNLNYNIYGSSTVPLSGNFPTGAWNHLAFTRSGTTFSAYKNGILVASGVQGGTLGNSGVCIIGATPGGGGPFSGYMDDFRFTSGVARPISTTIPALSNWANPTDLTKTKTTATVYNGPGYSGGYLSFNGTNQYMQTNLIPNNPQMSLNIWFNSSTFSSASSYACLLSDQISGNPNFDIRKKNGVSNVLELSVKVSGVAEILNDLATINNNTWYNIQVTYDQNNIVGYLNGVQTFSYAATAPLDITTTGVCIAQNPSFAGRNLPCSVATLGIYSRGLTKNEVLQNYNAMKKRYGY